MPTFYVTINKVEAKSITVTVDAPDAFEAVREASRLAEKASEDLWQRDYELSCTDFKTSLKSPTE